MVTRLAVLGHPIAHSLSPKLHAAAYDVLGLDWSYEAIDVTGADLRDFVWSLGPDWWGLSLTMPLKQDVLPILDEQDDLTRLTGAANTVTRLTAGDGTLFVNGFNTDVGGIVAAFGDAGVTALRSVQVLGGGATAASVLVAAARLGAKTALVSARTPTTAERLVQLGSQLGVDVTVRPWGIQDRSLIVPDAVISTVPGGTPPPFVFPETVRRSAVLFDVAYDPWPSELASSWLEVGGSVVPGIRMLVHQALRQVRIFVNDDQDTTLEREDEVLAAMFASVGLGPAVGGS